MMKQTKLILLLMTTALLGSACSSVRSVIPLVSTGVVEQEQRQAALEGRQSHSEFYAQREALTEVRRTMQNWDGPLLGH